MSISAILDKIIKPQFRTKLNAWHQYATTQDIYGLQCINQIYDNKGTKKLKSHQPNFQRKQMSVTKGSRFLGQTDARINPTITSYKFYHGSSSLPKDPHASIFQFKKLSQIKISRPLNAMTITFIDNWIQIKDSRKYQQAILSCLRSLASKLQLADPHSTEMKTSYDWRSDWKLSKPVRMDKAGENLFAFKPNLTAIQKQEKKKQQHKQKMRELQKSQFAKQLKIFKEFKIN